MPASDDRAMSMLELISKVLKIAGDVDDDLWVVDDAAQARIEARLALINGAPQMEDALWDVVAAARTCERSSPDAYETLIEIAQRGLRLLEARTGVALDGPAFEARRQTAALLDRPEGPRLVPPAPPPDGAMNMLALRTGGEQGRRRPHVARRRRS